MIKNLTYTPDFIDFEEETYLIGKIDQMPWMNDLKRRTQHYGYRYDYTKKKIDSSARLDNMPLWLDEICQNLYQLDIFKSKPDQVIVNEYQPGQGISKHIDCPGCFGDVIASISLGSSCYMTFEHRDGSMIDNKFLERRSLLVMKGEARTDWLHSIAPKKFDRVNFTSDLEQEVVPRQRRISLTFRTILLSDENVSLLDKNQ